MKLKERYKPQLINYYDLLMLIPALHTLILPRALFLLLGCSPLFIEAGLTVESAQVLHFLLMS